MEGFVAAEGVFARALGCALIEGWCLLWRLAASLLLLQYLKAWYVKPLCFHRTLGSIVHMFVQSEGSRRAEADTAGAVCRCI